MSCLEIEALSPKHSPNHRFNRNPVVPYCCKPRYIEVACQISTPPPNHPSPPSRLPKTNSPSSEPYLQHGHQSQFPYFTVTPHSTPQAASYRGPSNANGHHGRRPSNCAPTLLNRRSPRETHSSLLPLTIVVKRTNNSVVPFYVR